MPQFMTIAQAMGILNVSRPTIYRRIKAGEIPVVRLGRRVLIPADFFETLRGRATDKIPPAGEQKRGRNDGR